MRCPRCQHENRPQATFCGKCTSLLEEASLTTRSNTDTVSEVESLKQALTEAAEQLKATAELLQTRNRELADAQEQQAATNEILRVIATSPTDVQPVFAAVLRSAARLCDALDASIFQVAGGGLRLVAHEGPILSHPVGDFPLIRGLTAGRAVLDRRTIHVPDVQAEVDEYPDSSLFARSFGVRTTLSVPLLRGTEAIGAIAIRRTEVRPFTDRQIELLQTFAAQAVIAIENVRLFNETQETLEQQTATGEILRVIANSPTDIQPVFDAVAESAARFCGATDASIWRLEGQSLRLVAVHGTQSTTIPIGGTIAVTPGALPGRVVLDRQTIHVEDIQASDTEFPETQERARRVHVPSRTLLATPLLREDVPIGVIVLRRREVQLFTAKQIELLKTFAAQAVIAIENVRLFNETQETLEQQTATGEILRVIASSPTDVQPVFDTIVRSAARLCDGVFGGLYRFDGELIHLAAAHNLPSEALAAARQIFPAPLTRELTVGRAILDRTVAHIPDVELDPEYKRSWARTVGARSALTVPMFREGHPIGTINVGRAQPGPFSEKQIELLKTFADQAVIAIENVRLFKELQARNAELTEALEQQTATAEILRVISNSPTDVQPVFDTIVRSATRLCDGTFCNLTRFDGELLHQVASYNFTPEALEFARPRYPRPLTREHAASRAILDRASCQIADVESEPGYDPSLARAIGFRSVLAVPMFREGSPIGAIAVARAVPGPFSTTQIELLKTFADQAVIAIENVRLFTELQTRNRELTETLEQQTATAEILRVIASSRTDVQPVFEAIVRSAVRLCEAANGSVTRFDGTVIHVVAEHGFTPEALEANRRAFPRPPGRGSVVTRAILTRAVVHVDIAEDPEYEHGVFVHAGLGFRWILSVPMLREGNPIGAITLTRQQGRPFSDTQIALLQTFADQAVIAIENVRLFTELQEKNRALTQAHAQVTEALEQQTATAEILQVISSSPTDVQPVFDTILANATRLCEAKLGALFLFDGEAYHAAAFRGAASALVEHPIARDPIRPGPHTALARVQRELRPVHIDDVLADAGYAEGDPLRRAVVELEGMRTLLMVPLLQEGRLVGAFGVHRREVRPFTDSQIGLMQTFAAQAVIAIENVRLFHELQARNAELTESLEQQTATGEVLRVISSSPTDLQPVMDVVAASAARFCGATRVAIIRLDGNSLRIAAAHGPSPSNLPVGTTYDVSRRSVAGRAALDRETLHIVDLQTLPETEFPDTLERDRHAGFPTRTVLATPLMREGISIGVIYMRRNEVLPFTDRQIELAKTFADQAVIAIENVRLFTELQERNRALTEAHAQVTEALERQTATSEILRVISQSPTDVQPVFDIIAQRAVSLSDAEVGTVSRFDGAVLQLAALHGITREGVEAVRAVFPTRPDAETLAARAFRARAVIHVEDVLADPRYQAKDAARAGGWRGALAVPMFRATEVIGVIFVGRSTARLFTDSQIELLKTFADQAVIAIENVRLFTELEARTQALTRSVNELTALGDVSRALSSTLDLETVLQTIVTRANELAGTDACWIYEYDDTREEFRLRASSYADPGEGKILNAIGRATPIPKGQGVASRAAALRQPVQVPDLAVDATYESPIRGPLVQAGYRAVLTVPLLLEEHVIGALSVSRKTPGEFAPEVLRLLTTFATQCALAIQNARLFREIADKSRQLEAASRHKSEFLANMSHELRTPLNAILGFNEMILGEIYGGVPADLKEPLTDIQHSGKHLLRLINNVLDLSKIEAGRMELALTDYTVQDIVERVRASLQSLAAEKGLAFVATVSADVPLAYGDGGRITQCLMNLAGNALKFTHRGRVELGVELQGDLLVYRVADTGIGIAPDKIEGVFTEFRQGDATITSEFGGTGLGLSITRKFVEMHGGRIWVESEVGRGSTFFFAIPVRLTGGTPA